MLKLGIVQFSVIEGKVEKNKKHFEEIVSQYHTAGIDILCFPELCISGYVFEAARDAEEIIFIKDMARKYRQAIIAGIHFIEDEKHYDGACLIDENGVLLGDYRKIHLWEAEKDFFESGQNIGMCKYKDWNIGLLLCADMGFPELSLAMTKNYEAEVIFYLSAWAQGWKELFTTCGKARAAENQIYTISLNRGAGDVTYCGSTIVAGPNGETVDLIDSEEEKVIIVTLSKERIEEARKAIPWTTMKKPEVYNKFD